MANFLLCSKIQELGKVVSLLSMVVGGTSPQVALSELSMDGGGGQLFPSVLLIAARSSDVCCISFWDRHFFFYWEYVS
jgi:hypothetical protein